MGSGDRGLGEEPRRSRGLTGRIAFVMDYVHDAVRQTVDKGCEQLAG